MLDRDSSNMSGRRSAPQMGATNDEVQDPPDTHWFLAQLKPAGFERAKTNLARQGFKFFMPMQEYSHRRRGRWSSATRPLFPGYLFVHIPPSRRDWRAINSTYGINRLVALENAHPTEVPSILMSALRARTDPEGHLQAPDDLVAGKRVRIVDGPFANHIAEIESVVPGDRVVLLMQLIGGLVRAKVEPGALEVI